jgi:hypothetical protein
MRTVLAGAFPLLLAGVMSVAAAQNDPTVDALLEQLGQYLERYEQDARALIADEHYSQKVYQIINDQRWGIQLRGSAQRTLDSQVAFLRFDGEIGWIGIREVRQIDGEPVEARGVGLLDILKGRGDPLRDLESILEASSKHSLGPKRTVNTPAVPLELLRFHHHPRFIFRVRGNDKIDGVRVTRLDLAEFDGPSVLHNSNGTDIFMKGSVWIEPATGRVWRIELTWPLGARDAITRMPQEGLLRLDFARDDALGILVPKNMTERFYVPRGRGEGEATYTNYRRVVLQ